MIQFLKATVVTSVQDAGRVGHRSSGHARSGAMDVLSLQRTNAAAGASPGAAGIELGPGPCTFEITAKGTIAFGGAVREGAPWWRTIEVRPGDRFELSSPRDGAWSYLGLAGGVEAPVMLGSRSASVREGIGAWITAGAEIKSGGESSDPQDVEPAAMTGPIRLFGEMPGSWRVGTRTDRMGYMLDGEPLRSGTADEWSEPLLPGFIQVPPSGMPIALMVEGPTVGGYRVAAMIHSGDVRLLAQRKPGDEVTFIPEAGYSGS